MFFSTLPLAIAALPFALAAPATLSITTPSSITAPLATLATAAPLVVVGNNTIKDSYLVVFKNGTEESAQSKMKAYIHSKATQRNKTMRGVFASFKMSSMKAYAINADNNTLAEIRADPLVAYVEKDNKVKIAALDYNPAVHVESEFSLDKRFNMKQTVSTSAWQWNLPRISHRNNTGSSDYIYDSTAGIGTRVYIIDSGIQVNHTEFNGRASWGANFVTNSTNTDENGHGTHVAGTVGGVTYGVAKQTTLIAVKVLDASGAGSTSGLIQGIQWAVADAQSKKMTNRTVINMSLGGGVSTALNAAVNAAINAGVTVVVAAGNNGANAANYSPASVANAITVGATDNTDSKPNWSNWGTPLDVFAPGAVIQSSWIGSTTASAYMSGTSMACPHVAGLAAYLITREGLATPAAVAARIAALATQGKVSSPGAGSVNLLAYNGNGQ